MNEPWSLSIKMTTAAAQTPKYTRCACSCSRETNEEKHKSRERRCAVQREKGLKIEGGLITGGG